MIKCQKNKLIINSNTQKGSKGSGLSGRTGTHDHLRDHTTTFTTQPNPPSKFHLHLNIYKPLKHILIQNQKKKIEKKVNISHLPS